MPEPATTPSSHKGAIGKLAHLLKSGSNQPVMRLRGRNNIGVLRIEGGPVNLPGCREPVEFQIVLQQQICQCICPGAVVRIPENVRFYGIGSRIIQSGCEKILLMP